MKKTAWIYGILALGIMFWAIYLGGAGILYFVDIPTMVIIPIAAFLLSFMSHGFEGVLLAYKTALFKKNQTSKEFIEKGIAVFKGLQRNFVFLSFAGVLTGVIAMLVVVTEVTSFARGLAVAILSFYYAVLGILFLVLPFKNRLEEAKAEQNQAN
jgi:flagellar motor component MotA